MRALSLFSFVVLFIAVTQVGTTGSFGTNVVDFLNLSFAFDWNAPGVPLPNPTTAQCSTINIKWERAPWCNGPTAVPPYTLVLMNSNTTVPYVISGGDGPEYDLMIPFAPGTRYQICMFDQNAQSGGCQDLYTVYPSENTECEDLPVPSQTLDVEGLVETGPISQYGWTNQCTDISLIPKNGTPPFTMLIYPALHPPYKVTSDTMDPINWTISLSWTVPFFISLTDSNNISWSAGPMHSGGPSTTECFSLVPGAKPKKEGLSLGVVIGSNIGVLVFGVVVGIVASLLARNQFGRNSSTDSIDQTPFKRTAAPHGPSTAGPDLGNNQYHVEPFLPEGPNSSTQNTLPLAPTSADPNPQPGGGGSGSDTQRNPQVYVVHNDAGGAPVTVFTGGARVTELPPSYMGRSESQPTIQPPTSGSSGVDQVDRRAQPGPTPRKSQASLR